MDPCPSPYIQTISTYRARIQAMWSWKRTWKPGPSNEIYMCFDVCVEEYEHMWQANFYDKSSGETTHRQHQILKEANDRHNVDSNWHRKTDGVSGLVLLFFPLAFRSKMHLKTRYNVYLPSKFPPRVSFSFQLFLSHVHVLTHTHTHHSEEINSDKVLKLFCWGQLKDLDIFSLEVYINRNIFVFRSIYRRNEKFHVLEGWVRTSVDCQEAEFGLIPEGAS